MASYWQESSQVTKITVGLAVVGVAGVALYYGTRRSGVKPSVTEPSTPKPSATEPSTPKPSATEPSTPKPSATEPSTPKPSVTEPSASKSDETDSSGKNQDPIHVSLSNPRSADSAAQSQGPMATHEKCRAGVYPRGGVMRSDVPKDKVSWTVPFPEYKPVAFTSESVAKKPVWADPDFMTEAKWNAVDKRVDRRSHNGEYQIVNGFPRNPIGRTGMCERGTLGRWGPNHAADPIVTRWKLDQDGRPTVHPRSKRRILQFVAIKRRDSGIWAIPGGMVDPGEKVSVTLKREFSEEALNTLEMSKEERHKLEEQIQHLFQAGTQVYRGYVDDPRNTDNSWMETIAVNFHDDTGKTIGRVHLNAGDDAVGVQWTDIDSSLNLYASHADFIKQVAELHNAHW